MDHEFLLDATGQVVVKFSMGHEVIGHWFNEEVKGNLTTLDKIEAAMAAAKGSDWHWPGREYSLSLDDEEVMVRANQLDFANDDIEEGMNYYDEESLSLCGTEDFLAVLKNYREFLRKS